MVLRYLFAVDGWQAQVRASARAEADALQARIKPHFLFNSMNTIAGLVRHDPVVAERAVLDLSDLFRAALGAGEADSSLREEVELAERYLAIETLRLGDRLQVRLAPARTAALATAVAAPGAAAAAGERGAARRLAPAAGRLRSTSTWRPTASVLQSASAIRRRRPNGHDRRRRSATRSASIGHRLAYAFGPRARMTARGTRATIAANSRCRSRGRPHDDDR